MTRHQAAPNPREQYRTRAHAHGFPPDAFLECVDDYAGVAGLPWQVAADAVETQWLLEGPDLHAHQRRRTTGVDFTKLEELEATMRANPKPHGANLIEVLTAGIIVGLSAWSSAAVIYLVASKALELFGLRGTAVLAALGGAALGVAINIGGRR